MYRCVGGNWVALGALGVWGRWCPKAFCLSLPRSSRGNPHHGGGCGSRSPAYHKSAYRLQLMLTLCSPFTDLPTTNISDLVSDFKPGFLFKESLISHPCRLSLVIPIAQSEILLAFFNFPDRAVANFVHFSQKFHFAPLTHTITLTYV